MSFDACAWAVRQKLDCSTTKLILIGLADSYNAKSGKCFPSRAALADIACCSVRTVTRKLTKLAEEGWITMEAHFSASGRQESNSYKLNFSRDAEGGQSVNPQDNPTRGGGHDSVQGGRDTTMSHLTTKNSMKKNKRAEARNDQIDLEEAIEAAKASDDSYRQRMRESFRELRASLQGNTTTTTAAHSRKPERRYIGAKAQTARTAELCAC